MDHGEQPESFLKGASGSYAILALIMVVTFDLCFRFYWAGQQSSTHLSFDVPYRSRVWWAVQDYFKQEKTPDVVLMGASDLATAFYTAEATFLNKPESELVGHTSQYFDDKLKAENSPFATGFSLAIPGQMPSDAFFIANTLFTEQSKPKAVFLSISPRSFYDATFGDPTATDIFKVMSKLGGTTGFELSSRSSPFDQADYVMRQLFSVYGRKWEMTTLQHHLSHDLLSKVDGQKFLDVETPSSVRKITERELPEDSGPNELVCLPFEEKTSKFIDNLAEYKTRYQKFNRQTFDQQFQFYERLCALCRTRGIELVVCNSPTTIENRQLLPDSIYDGYLSRVGEITRRYGGSFFDLNKPELFAKSDFLDTVHLNGRGGEKYLDQAALALDRGSRLASSPSLLAH